MRSWLSGLVAVGASVFFALAIVRNQTAVDVDWVFGSARGVSVWRVLVAAALFGALFSALVLSIPALRLRLRLRRAERRIAELEREVHGLRTLPLEAEVRDPVRGA